MTRIIENCDGSLNLPLNTDLYLIIESNDRVFNIQKVRLRYENVFVDSDDQLSIRTNKLIVKKVGERHELSHEDTLGLMEYTDILSGDIDKPGEWGLMEFDWSKGWSSDRVNYHY